MKAMLIHWGWRLLGALLGVLVGIGLAVGLGDAIGKALDISNFEGGRGYFVLLVLIPLFGLSGLILGALMIYWKWQWNLGIVLSLCVVGGLFVWTHRDAFIPPPPQVEAIGNFQLLTYDSEDWGQYYALRYRDEPFTIEGRAGLFGDQIASYQTLNTVITFTLPLSSTAPAFIVNVGDPNNSSFFYLVREEAGQATVTDLCATSGGVVAVDWLDVAPSDPTVSRNLVLRRAGLTGGRWLLLGDSCVLDVQTLTPYRFDTYPLGDGSDASLNQSKLPIGLSPDQHSFVRVGSQDVRDEGTGDFRGYVARLIVYDFIDNSSYTLPVERRTMRYGDVSMIDNAWLLHHFAWQATAGAPDRLVQRADFTLLPYQGYFSGLPDEPQYNLVPVKADLLDKLVGFLEQKYQAQQGATQRYDTSTYVDLQIGEQSITVGYSNDGYSEPKLSVWQGSSSEQTMRDDKLIEAIGRSFDQVLRTGVYDMLFLGDPVAVTIPEIEGVKRFTDLAQEHVTTPVQYAQTPPVGGQHSSQWLNCGIYNVPVQNEHAVHSLEHGAVWITYQPALPADQVATLKTLTKAGSYRLLSPYPGLPSPIVASAWGLQLQVETAADPRLEAFVKTYENRSDGPEYGAPCSGGIGDPEL